MWGEEINVPSLPWGHHSKGEFFRKNKRRTGSERVLGRCCSLAPPHSFGFGMPLWDRFPHFIPPGLSLEITLELEIFSASSSSLRALGQQQGQFSPCPGPHSHRNNGNNGNNGFAPAGAHPGARQRGNPARSCHLLSPCPALVPSLADHGAAGHSWGRGWKRLG